MDVGSIASIATYMSQANLMQNVGAAVLDMAMDADKVQAREMASMMESAVSPGLGGSIDYRV